MDMPDKIWIGKGVRGECCFSDEWVDYPPESDHDDHKTPYTRTDLAQSLADALESTLADFKAHTQWNGEELDTIKQARSALANYRKGEST